MCFCTEALSLEDSLHSAIQFHGFYLKKLSFIHLSLSLVASFVFDKSLNESIRNLVPHIKKLVWRELRPSCVIAGVTINLQHAEESRMIIKIPQLRSTVESLVHAHQLNPNNPLAQPHRVSSISSKLSEYHWQQQPGPVCYACLCKHEKVLLVDPSVQFELLAISQSNPTPISRWDLGEQLPLNLLCACKSSDSFGFLSCYGWNCPVIKTKTPGNICRLWYLKIQNKSTVQLQLILLQSRWWTSWFPEASDNSMFCGQITSRGKTTVLWLP